MLSSLFFALVHIAQFFSGADFIFIILTVINAFIFGIIASEIVIIIESLVPVIILHSLYNFINWTSPVSGGIEIALIVLQSLIMTAYGIYLWTKLPVKHINGKN